MKLAFFAVPALGGEEAGAEVNRFLGAHRVVSLDRRLVSDGRGAYWAICVSYLEGVGEPAVLKRGKIDYKEVLSDADFAAFARLRALRKEIAEREGVPAYALLTRSARTAGAASFPGGPRPMCRRYDVSPGDGPKGSNRVIRGGSWNSNARNVRAAYRNHDEPSDRRNNLGFRLARAQSRAGGPAADPAVLPSASDPVEAAGSGKSFLGRRRVARAADAAARARRRPDRWHET